LNGRLYTFINELKSHLEEKNNDEYSKDLLSLFYSVFFQNYSKIGSTFYLWESDFPAEWKVTISNLEKNEFSKITLNEFKRWIRTEIISKIAKDLQFDELLRNLFPEVDPILWATIIIFVYSGSINAAVQNKRYFGNIGGTYVNVNEQELKKIKEREFTETFKLSLIAFPEYFSKGKIEQYIDNLNKLKLIPESNEYRNRQELIGVFKKMLEYVK